MFILEIRLAMIKKLLFILSFFVITRSGQSQTLGFALSDGRKKVQIPIEINNNLIILPVVLNGMLPLKFILDTGVRTTILTEKTFTDILNLSYSRKYTISGPGGEKLVDAYVTNNVSLDLPGVHGEGHAVLVLAEDYLQLRNYLGTDVHGILGYELFSRFIIKVDYEKKLLTVMTPEKSKPGNKYEKIPIRIEDTKPFITAEVVENDGTEMTAKLLVDSGASHGLMLESTSDPRIKVPENSVSSIIGRGLGGVIMGKVGRVKSVSLGNYLVNNPISNFPDPNSYSDSLKVGSVARNGSIGGEILSRFTVIFDFSNEKIYLKKNRFFNKKFYYNLSGLTIKAKGSNLNVFEITEVRHQSVSDYAGVMEGDIIVSINGTLSSNLTLNEVIGILNNRDGKRIRIDLNRNGKRLKKKFTLQDQI